MLKESKTAKSGECCTPVQSQAKAPLKALGLSKAKPLTKARGNDVQHPDHSTVIKKLNRVIGQIQGIQRMIDDRRYCPDILVQTRAAASALKAVELSILEKHVNNCVANTLKNSRTADSEEKIKELMELLARF